MGPAISIHDFATVSYTILSDGQPKSAVPDSAECTVPAATLPKIKSVQQSDLDARWRNKIADFVSVEWRRGDIDFCFAANRLKKTPITIWKMPAMA